MEVILNKIEIFNKAANSDYDILQLIIYLSFTI